METMEYNNQATILRMAYVTISKLHNLALGDVKPPHGITLKEQLDVICQDFYNDVDPLESPE